MARHIAPSVPDPELVQMRLLRRVTIVLAPILWIGLALPLAAQAPLPQSAPVLADSPDEAPEGSVRVEILPPPRDPDAALPWIEPLPEGLGSALPHELSEPAFSPPGTASEAEAETGEAGDQAPTTLMRPMCELRVNGLTHVLALEPEAAEDLPRARRGHLPLCPAPQVFAYLGERYGIAELEGYCLAEAEDASALLVPGQRDRRGGCERTLCERVRARAQEVRDTAGFMAAGLDATLSGRPGGVQSRAGALIVTGAVNWVAGNIGTVGSALGSALSSPAVLGVATVSVVTVGGALYLCRE